MKFSLVWSLLFSCALTAQGLRVVPNPFASTEGSTFMLAPGTAGAERLQCVIDVVELEGIQGRRLTSLVLRRDVNVNPEALATSQVSLRVRVGSAFTAPSAVFADFGTNVGTAQILFDGTVNLPASADTVG